VVPPLQEGPEEPAIGLVEVAERIETTEGNAERVTATSVITRETIGEETMVEAMTEIRRAVSRETSARTGPTQRTRAASKTREEKDLVLTLGKERIMEAALMGTSIARLLQQLRSSLVA
jgi:hypothetical protein